MCGHQPAFGDECSFSGLDPVQELQGKRVDRRGVLQVWVVADSVESVMLGVGQCCGEVVGGKPGVEHILFADKKEGGRIDLMKAVDRIRFLEAAGISMFEVPARIVVEHLAEQPGQRRLCHSGSRSAAAPGMRS